MWHFMSKNYGRIVVQKEEDVEKVRQVIREIDCEEYEHYLPQDLICVFKKDDIETVYTHKFDSIDLNELQIRCWEKGVPIMILDGILDFDYGKYKESRELK